MSVTVQTPPDALLRRSVVWQLRAAVLVSGVFVVLRILAYGFAFSAAEVIALGASVLVGWWVNGFLVRGVRGNVYYTRPIRRLYFVVLGVLGIALVETTYRQQWVSVVMAHPAILPVGVSYFWTGLFGFLWLRRYEREHGPVRIVVVPRRYFKIRSGP